MVKDDGVEVDIVEGTRTGRYSEDHHHHRPGRVLGGPQPRREASGSPGRLRISPQPPTGRQAPGDCSVQANLNLLCREEVDVPLAKVLRKAGLF